jgi:hypothetical protein
MNKQAIIDELPTIPLSRITEVAHDFSKFIPTTKTIEDKSELLWFIGICQVELERREQKELLDINIL